MREHLYRGKAIYDNDFGEKGIWVYGIIFQDCSGSILGEKGRWGINGFTPKGHNCFTAIDPETIGQFIGLSDENSKKNFEGDIFTVCGRCPKLVKFIDKRAAFCIANIDQLKDEKWFPVWGSIDEVWWNDFKDEIEAIGNIHDNPELLGAQNE